MAVRPPVTLRDAELGDAEGLAALWSECARAGKDDDGEAFSQQSLWREPVPGEATQALALHLAKPDKRIIVAVSEDEIVGVTVCETSTLTPVTMTRVLVVTDIQVSPRFRRRSVASSLLSLAADHGEAHGCEVIVAAIPVQAREPHRYLTKLGFSQIAVVRAISASKLRSRLSQKATQSRDTGRLIAVRRTLRRRADGRRGPRD